MRPKKETKLYHQTFKDGGNMDSFIQKLKDQLLKPDASDQERIERWKREIDEAGRLKELHQESRKQDQQAKKARGVYPMQAPFKLER